MWMLDLHIKLSDSCVLCNVRAKKPITTKKLAVLQNYHLLDPTSRSKGQRFTYTCRFNTQYEFIHHTHSQPLQVSVTFIIDFMNAIERLSVEIQTALQKHLLLIIILLIHAARDEDGGTKVCRDLSKELNVTNIKFHQLDITSQESIDKLRAHVQDKFGGLDVLINNSGVLLKVRRTQ